MLQPVEDNTCLQPFLNHLHERPLSDEKMTRLVQLLEYHYGLTIEEALQWVKHWIAAHQVQ